MAQVKVFNDNVHEFKQSFRGKEIKIPPKEFILMDEAEAYDFQGDYFPMKKDKHNQPDPKFFKIIRIEHSQAKAEAKPDPLVCMKCSYKSASSKDLEEHVKANHLDDLADQKVAQELKGKR